MAGNKDPLSVLIISGSHSAAEKLSNILPGDQFLPVNMAFSAGEAKRQLVDIQTDIILINAPLPDEPAAHLAADISEEVSAGILLLVKSELFEQTAYMVEDYGILTLSKPISTQAFYQALKLLAATLAKLRAYERKNASLQSKMEEIRLINRAKLLLIDRLKMSESEAHRYIEKQAMDTCSKRRSIAESIIRIYGD